MSAVLITYDLNKPGQNYALLHEKIKALGTWWHYLDSTWIVVTSLTASQVFDKLKPAVDAADHVLVLNVSGDSYSGWLTQEAWDWLKKYV